MAHQNAGLLSVRDNLHSTNSCMIWSAKKSQMSIFWNSETSENYIPSTEHLIHNMHSSITKTFSLPELLKCLNLAKHRWSEHK